MQDDANVDETCFLTVLLPFLLLTGTPKPLESQKHRHNNNHPSDDDNDNDIDNNNKNARGLVIGLIKSLHRIPLKLENVKDVETYRKIKGGDSIEATRYLKTLLVAHKHDELRAFYDSLICTNCGASGSNSNNNNNNNSETTTDMLVDLVPCQQRQKGVRKSEDGTSSTASSPPSSNSITYASPAAIAFCTSGGRCYREAKSIFDDWRFVPVRIQTDVLTPATKTGRHQIIDGVAQVRPSPKAKEELRLQRVTLELPIGFPNSWMQLSESDFADTIAEYLFNYVSTAVLCLDHEGDEDDAIGYKFACTCCKKRMAAFVFQHDIQHSYRDSVLNVRADLSVPICARLKCGNYAFGLCYCCQTTGDPRRLMSCANCRKVHYCDRECQKDDWKRHKLECRRPPQPDVLIDEID